MSCHAFLQGIFPTQGLNLSLASTAPGRTPPPPGSAGERVPPAEGSRGHLAGAGLEAEFRAGGGAEGPEPCTVMGRGRDPSPRLD